MTEQDAQLIHLAWDLNDAKRNAAAHLRKIDALLADAEDALAIEGGLETALKRLKRAREMTIGEDPV